MSLPEFPTITDLTREDAINQIISSIAMEELALSHIINAEGEKLQYILGTIPGVTGPAPTIEQVLEVNESVRAVLQTAAENQSALRLKLQNALSASVLRGPIGPAGPTGPAGPAFGLNAFGGIYNKNTARANAMTANVPVVVDMPLTTGARNISYSTPNSITVTETGLYYLSYDMMPDFSAAAILTFAVRSNGINIAVTENIIDASPSYTWYAGNTIIDLPAGAVVDVAVTSNVNQTMSFDTQSTESLALLKLN